MPFPGDLQGGQMPRSSPEGEGGGDLGPAGIDWGINKAIDILYDQSKTLFGVAWKQKMLRDVTH